MRAFQSSVDLPASATAAGKEPQHFLRLFAGDMIVHNGGVTSKFEARKKKRSGDDPNPGVSLYQVRAAVSIVLRCAKAVS